MMVTVLSLAMILTFVPYMGSITAYADDQEPAPIQDTYEIDGVTYYNTGSTAFTRDQNRFYKELLGTRSDKIKLSVPKAGVTDKNCSIADAWLLMGLALTQHKIDVPSSTDLYETLARVAVEGSYEEEDDDGSLFIDGKRYDLTAATSLKKAEEYVLSDIHGDNAVEAQLSDKTTEEPVLVSAVNLKQGHKNITLAAYFTNFRVSPILPEDKGSNYVTTTVKDNVSTSNTTAYAIRNNTGSSVSGTQSLSTSTSYSVSSSISGSESYSFSESIKYGGGYEFPVGVKLNIELGFSASQAVSEGWSEGKSHSDTKSNSQSVNVTLPPYTSVLLKTKTTEAEYVSRYNCPVALVYDVILVGYDAYRVSTSDPIQYTMFTLKDQTGGARAEILERSKLPETYSDEDGIAWNGSYSFLDNLKHGDYWCQYDVMDYVSGYVPMSSTGASFRDSATIVSSEVEEFMPLLPLRRIKITEPKIGVVSDELTYGNYTYYTAKMNIGDYSYVNYMTLVGLNEKDAPYYSFSKDNGYWVLTDKDGNEIDSDTAPVELVKDPVSGNWRYTAVRPGTCFLVFRIYEDIYATADAPEDYMKNEDLWKTAALEIIVEDNVDIPEGKTLTYNGELQTGVPEGEDYDITGNTATDVGEYTATLKLKDENAVWSDGTKEAKKITWKITAKKITPVVTLSDSSYTYDGKVKKPTVTVKDGSTKLATSQYTVTYASGRKNVGKYNVKVTLKGNYSGSKTVSYKINPKGRSIKSLTPASKAITVNWVKQATKMSTSYISGYQIYVATDSKFTKNVKKVYVEKYSTVSKKITGLKGGTKYYVKIRTYKTVNGIKYYSPFSAVKTVTTKK